MNFAALAIAYLYFIGFWATLGMFNAVVEKKYHRRQPLSGTLWMLAVIWPFSVAAMILLGVWQEVRDEWKKK